MTPRFSLGAVLALVLAAPLAAAAAQPPVCAKPEWPQEARRYELEGVTTLKFRIDPQGRPIESTVARSSNWELLDQASIQALSTCVFPAETVQRVQGKTVPLQFVWKLEGSSRVPPLFTEGSCAPSERFSRFAPLQRGAPGEGGVLVRLLVRGDGVPYGVKAEAGGADPELAQAAIAYAQSCRFAYPKTGGAPGSPVTGRVLLKQ
ncbi:energy transducer TonB [Massilia sp. IC2-477]|uniref:energy transducer TonB n=1 Tax=unclassified Massilia TaxID=2609279 RepID=UPI001D110C60|nr:MULTISPECIES: energy transducer TonB [unclassified Massilia]MCC2956300.1 energy transducer TonB [Massilia sp. IC2-477]MCC2972329.1 energy transducer TonB [Massilia sp. IC2-476]